MALSIRAPGPPNRSHARPGPSRGGLACQQRSAAGRRAIARFDSCRVPCGPRTCSCGRGEWRSSGVAAPRFGWTAGVSISRAWRSGMSRLVRAPASGRRSPMSRSRPEMLRSWRPKTPPASPALSLGRGRSAGWRPWTSTNSRRKGAFPQPLTMAKSSRLRRKGCAYRLNRSKGSAARGNRRGLDLDGAYGRPDQRLVAAGLTGSP